jgi:hypothetical protein
MVLLFSATLFVSALLLFLIQPMIAKMVLPLLGGSPSVWNTCMVFFQAVLLAGYAYAHALPSRLGVRRHAIVHLAVLALPIALLPVRVTAWSRPDVVHPVPWLLGLLVVSVGAPAFAIAAAAPLLQRWFADTGHLAGRDPYFLYAASNAGSMCALIGYPLVLEPHIGLRLQNLLWGVGYGALLVLTIACAIALLRARPAAPEAARADVDPGDAAVAPPTWREKARWAVLAAIPSSLMLGVTTYITTDIAPVPLFWVIPLALYLLTYIIAFARPPRWIARAAAMLLTPLVIALMIAHPFHSVLPITAVLALHLSAFFVAALLCHGELAETRPPARDLTAFYLWLSIGGVIGGALNALVAPVIFPQVVEYPLVIALVFVLRSSRAPAPTPAAAPRKFQGKRAAVRPQAQPVRRGRGWAVFGALAALVFFIQSYGGDPRYIRLSERNFFGVHRVKLDPVRQLIGLQYGTTVHGMQSTDPAKRNNPLGYYYPTGPIGEVFAAWEPMHPGRPIAVVGLGIGSLSCYAKSGQAMTFYELDPEVIRLARDTTYFTRLSDAEARGVKLTVVLGDARLQLRRSGDRYALLILDAFNSDAVPVHLLTREALQTYLDHLEPGGLLAIHISSQYFRLEPVVKALAHDAGLEILEDLDPASDPIERDAGKVASRWVVMARTRADFGALADNPQWHIPAGREGVGEWTDDYSNLPGVILWGGNPGSAVSADE